MSTAWPLTGDETRPDASEVHPGANALIAEARRHRQRRRRRALLAVACVLPAVAAVSAVVLAGPVIHHEVTPPRTPAGAAAPMPSRVVVWTGSAKVEVLSARTGRVLRTLASNVALYRGLTTVTASAKGMVYFDRARGHQEWVMSVPLAGGPVTAVAAGRDPAVSPDGRLLAYVTNPDQTGAPEAIVVSNLMTGTQRRWAFTSAQPDIDSLSWAPGSAYLAFTVNTRPFQAATVRVLDTRSAGGLASARPIPLASRLQWAGFLTPAIGLVVDAERQILAEVAVATGRVQKQLVALPSRGLFTSNVLAGTDGAIAAAADGHYLLIAGIGPDGHGEIFRWTMGTRQLDSVARGAVRASWAG